MTTGRAKIEAIMKDKTLEEQEQIAQHVREQAALLAFKEISYFLSQAQVENEVDGLIGNLGAAVINSMKNGFRELIKEHGNLVTGYYVAKMSTKVLRELANTVEREALMMASPVGGVQ